MTLLMVIELNGGDYGASKGHVLQPEALHSEKLWPILTRFTWRRWKNLCQVKCTENWQGTNKDNFELVMFTVLSIFEYIEVELSFSIQFIHWFTRNLNSESHLRMWIQWNGVTSFVYDDDPHICFPVKNIIIRESFRKSGCFSAQYI